MNAFSASRCNTPRLIAAVIMMAATLRLVAADIHVLPEPAGSGDGTSWGDAAGSSRLQELALRLQPGDGLLLGSGTYRNVELDWPVSGESKQPVAIRGCDTGAGLPVIQGDWDKSRPDTGPVFCQLEPGVGFVQISDLEIRHYRSALYAKGRNEGLVISGLKMNDFRIGLLFIAGTQAGRPDLGSHDILIKGCTFTGFTKSAARFEEGNHDVRLTDCHADAGGKAYSTEPFQMAFIIKGDKRVRSDPAQLTHDHDFTFLRCSARNSYQDKGDGYWNGDGFVAERGVYNLTFIDCMAFDCTDGGWDLKADNVLFRGCVSFRNKRNFRLWGTARMENCIAGFPLKRGGSGVATNVGVYTRAVVRLDHCTLIGDVPPFNVETKGEQPDQMHAFIKDSLIVSISTPLPPASGEDRLVEHENTTEVYMADPDAPVMFGVAPSGGWDGNGDAFDALPPYDGIGFRR